MACNATRGVMMRALDEGREPEISGRDNLQTMALVEAAYRSATEGRAILVTGMRADTAP